MFSLRIVTVDSYQSIPIKGYDCFYSEFRSCETYKVPVIRIFGVTPAGQKACLHVHGVFPYLLLRWKDVFPGIDIRDSHRYLQELALEIDKSLHVAARSSNSSRHHVFKISETKGSCFYGYHEDEEDFIRVYFYNPYDINRTTELLANGGIMNKVIQPHQAHFPFILQFSTDFNLSGMNIANVSQFKFRASNGNKSSEPSPLSSLLDSTDSGDRLWNVDALCSSQISTIPRQTHCELELDCCSSDIMNKIDGTMCVGENPGIAAIWAEERLRRKTENDTSPLTPIPSQDRVNAFETPSEVHFKGVTHKRLESQERNCPSIDILDVEDLPMDSQLSFFQSLQDSINLSNTQDRELLGDLLSMANDNNPENDSILGYEVESDSEEETIIMSQKFVFESWTSPKPGVNVFSSSAYEQKTEVYSTSTNINVIPQLDGANDDEDYEEYGPMLLKEEKVSSNTNLTNGTTEFDEEPPVLQPEQPLSAGASSYCPLQMQHSLELKRSCMMQCSVKMEEHPILKNIDPTKPVLLTSLGNSFNEPFFTSEKSSKRVLKNQDIKKSQRSKSTNAIKPTLCTKNGKISEKSQKVQHSVTKCVASVLSRVETMVDGSGKSHTLKTFNTELKFSKTCVKKVIASSSKCLDSDLQWAATPKFKNNFNGCSKESVDSEYLKKSSSKNKVSHCHTEHKLKKDKFKLSCDKIELNTKDLKVSTIKTSQIKSNSLMPHQEKGLVTNSLKSKSKTGKLSTKPSFECKGVDNLALNPKSNLTSTGLRDISKPSKGKEPSPNLLKPKSSKKDNPSSKRKHRDLSPITAMNDHSSRRNEKPKKIKIAATEGNKKTLSDNNKHIMAKNFPDITLRSDSDVSRNAETLSLNKLGKEVVVIKRMTEQQLASFLKPPSLENTFEQTDKASCSVNYKYTNKTSSKHLSKSQHLQKLNTLPQRTKHPSTKYLIDDKLSSEEKTSVVSKSMTSKSSSTQRYTFAKTCFESKSSIIKQNINNNQSVFSLVNNDDSDFTSSFNKHASTKLFDSKELLSPPTKQLPKSNQVSSSSKKKSRSHHSRYHNEKSSSTNRKSKSSKTVSSIPSTSSGLLEVSNKASKSDIKNVIEEQVKNSLDGSIYDEFPEIAVIGERSISDSTSRHIEVINLSSDEEDSSSAQPEPLKDKAVVPKVHSDVFPSSIVVTLVECADLIQEYYPGKLTCIAIKKDRYKKNYRRRISYSRKHLKPKSEKLNSLKHKIKCEKEQINEFSGKSNSYSKTMKIVNSSLVCAIKTEPIAHKEPSKNKEKKVFSSTSDAAKSILPYAVKSKPIVKTSSNFNGASKAICTLNKSPGKNEAAIYAVKSLPTLKASPCIKTNINKEVMLNKSTGTNASNCCPDSKLHTQNKLSSIYTSQSDTKPLKNVTDFMVMNGENTNNLPKANVTNKTTLPSPVKITKIEEIKLKKTSSVSSETILCNNKTEKSVSGIKEPALPKKKNCTPKSSTLSSSDAEKVNGKYKGSRKSRKKKGGRSRVKKNVETLPMDKDISFKKNTAIKSSSESNVANLFASDNAHSEDSASILSNAITSSKTKFLNCDSKSEDVQPNVLISQDYIHKINKCDLRLPGKTSTIIKEKSIKIFDKKSKSHDLPTSTNILSNDNKVANQEPSSEKGLLHQKRNWSKNSAIHTSNTAVAIQNNLAPKNIGVTKSTDQVELNDLKLTVNDMPGNVPIVENDLYDIVKRRNSNKNNPKTNTLVGSDKVFSNNCTDKILPNPKAPKCTRKCITKSDTLSFPTKNNTYIPPNSDLVATKEALEKPECNGVTEPELPSIDKSFVCSKDEAVLDSGEEEVSNRTRNKCALKEFVPISNSNTESVVAAIPLLTIESQTAKTESLKNPISLVARGRKGNKGKESNNFNYFSNKTSKRRRNSPETAVIPKPMSKKLSLKQNKSMQNNTVKVKNSSPLQPVTRGKWKIDNDLLKSTLQDTATVNPSEEYPLLDNITVKQEPLDEDDVPAQSSDMKDALSRFDFDESASIEPTSCMSYSSRRSRKNSQTKGSAEKLIYQKNKNSKSSHKQKKRSSRCRKGTKRSSELDISIGEKASDLNEASNKDNFLNFKVIQKSPTIKLKRDSSGQISVVPTNTSTSPLKCSAEKSKFYSDFQPCNSKYGVEEEPSVKLKIVCKQSSTNSSAASELQCIILSDDSNCEIQKAVKTTKERRSRRRSEPYTNPCEPLVPPIFIKNIKKEKIDDYEQQPYVVPLKVNLNTQSVTECDKIVSSEPKCQPLKLYRNADQFYINPAASKPKDETKVKRSRGRPRKASKDVPPVETEEPFANEKIPVLRIPKISAIECLEVDKRTSSKPLSRKTRSNSARASTSSHWSEVKIKQEPISDEEYAVPPSVTSELPTTSSITTRRRSSSKYENLKHCFLSDSEGSDDSEPKRIKGRSSRKRKMSERTKSSSNTNSPQKPSGRRASATTSFTQYFDLDKNDDSDECQVVYSTLPKKAKTSNGRRRKSSSSKKRRSSENSVAISDTAKSNPFTCRVNVLRLLPSEIEKHSLEPHTVCMTGKEKQSVSLGSASSDITGISDTILEKSKMPSLELETHSNETINRKLIEEKPKHDSFSQRKTRSGEKESILITTPPESSVVKLILDSPIGNLKKLTSMENSAETLHENVMKESNYFPATAPSTYNDSIAQPENLPFSEIVSHANVSAPEMMMKENLIGREKEQRPVPSPTIGFRKDLSPGSKIFAPGRGTFPHEWDSPKDIRVEKDVINGSLASSSPFKADNANNSNESPEVCDINWIDVESPKLDDNIDVTCISSMDASNAKTKVVGTSIPQKKRNMEGNLFDKVSEEMIKHVKVQRGIFDSTLQNKSFSEDNLISLEPQTSLPFSASREMNKLDMPFNKTTQDIQEPFKSLRGSFERRQDNQTVSCFKGYDLLSETEIVPPPCSQNSSRNMFEIPGQEIKDYSCETDNFCSTSVPKKSQFSGIHPSDNKHNSVDPNKTVNVHNINYSDMQMDNNLHCFSNSNNSYYETNRPQPTFSMQQNKYSNSFCNVKSNLHENQNANSAFSEAGWPNVNPSFCSNSRLTEKPSANIPLQLQKTDDPFISNAHQISSPDYFPKQQFGNTDISHLPNYFSPEDTSRLWSPIEQTKVDGSFGKSTELFLNEHASSNSAHYSKGIPSPVPTLPHLSFQRLPASNDTLQNNHLPGHLSVFRSSKEKNNSVECFDTNSLSSMSSSPKVLTVANESDNIMSPYQVEKSPSNLLKDDDTEMAMKSLSDVLAGSPLDVENDSLSINCDAFSASLEETAPENMPVSQITETQNFLKSETLTLTATDNKKISPVNKYVDTELSELTLENSFPTLDFTCLTENDVDHNLLDFEEIACNNSTVQTDMAVVSTSTVNISKSTFEKASETMSKNNTAQDVKEKIPPLTETLTNSSPINSAESAIAPYEVPFQNNIIPLVNLNQPNDECFPQLSIPSFSQVNQTFLPTLMVGESVIVPQSNFFLNDASIIINRDSATQDFVDILPNSAPVVDNSVSAISSSEPSSSREVGNFKQSFNEGEDILSMIVKSCDIGEEFDDNLGSPAEDMNESLPSDVNGSVALDSMIHSFYGDDTLYGLNQTNSETFCSDLQNINGTCEETSSISELKEGLKEPHIDNAISSSHLSVLPPSKKSTSELKLVNQTDIEGSSCGLSVNEAKITVVPLPKMQSISLFAHKTDTSNKTLLLHQKPKRRKKVNEVGSISYETSSEDSRDSNSVKTCDNQEMSYCMSSNLNANSQHQGKVQISFNAKLRNPSFASGDNLESTLSANRQENRNFLSEELGVSPINKDNLLTSDTKKKRRLSFGRKTVPYDKNFKKSDKDTAAGSYKRFWETSLLTNQSLESGQSLSKSDIDGPTLENSRGFKVNVDDLGDARVKHEV